MCGRFSSAVKPSDAWLAYLQEWPEQYFTRYNIAPTSQIGAFVNGKCHTMRWGLVPSWSKQISSKYATFNARIESIDTKPAFRNAWKHNQKCLIPAGGYYEWRKEEGEKQPYFVTTHDNAPIMFASLWDQCSFDSATLQSCTIITTESKDKLTAIHQRMPIMLDVDTAKTWMESGNDKSILLDQCLTDFDIYKVNKRVNNTREEDAELICPV